MATINELLEPDNRFTFRGKVYRLRSFCNEPSIDMVSEDGDVIGFGISAPLINEFILRPNI